MPTPNKYCTQNDLAKILCRKEKVDRKTAEILTDGYFRIIKDMLLGQNSVKLTEFGNFSVTDWKAQEVFDINTGKRIQTQIKSIKFKPSAALKRKVVED